MDLIDFSKNEDSIAKQAHIESVLLYGNPNAVPGAELTICIPTYKRCNYLKEAIKSSLDQVTNIPYRVLIVDNDSDFNNDEILNLIKAFDNKRILYYKNKENLLLFGNLNRAILLAETKWTALLHDDDLLLNNYIETISKILNKYGGRVEGISNSYIVQYDRVELNNTRRNKFINSTKWIFKLIQNIIVSAKAVIDIPLSANLFLRNAHGAPTCGMVFRRDVFLASGGFNELYFPAADWVLLIYFSHKYQFYRYRKPLGIYRFAINTSIREDVIKKNKGARRQGYLSLKKISAACRFWQYLFSKDFNVITETPYRQIPRVSVFYWIVQHIYILLYR
jgi:glycosyltransferase involved in cell wall biosynthesis